MLQGLYFHKWALLVSFLRDSKGYVVTNQVSPTVEFYLSNVGFILSKAQENNDLVF